jgi:hypothetical protein
MLIRVRIIIIPDITIKTAIPDGIRFSFNQSTGGVPSRARKTETRKRTTTDCARFIPAMIITIAAMLTRIRIPRKEFICSITNLFKCIFYLT